MVLYALLAETTSGLIKYIYSLSTSFPTCSLSLHFIEERFIVITRSPANIRLKSWLVPIFETKMLEFINMYY